MQFPITITNTAYSLKLLCGDRDLKIQNSHYIIIIIKKISHINTAQNMLV
jgi:hypothetical protein